MTRDILLTMRMSHEVVRELMSERVADVNSGIAPQHYPLDLLRDLLIDSGHVMQNQIDFLMQRNYNATQTITEYAHSDYFEWTITFYSVDERDITLMYLLYPEANPIVDLN